MLWAETNPSPEKKGEEVSAPLVGEMKKVLPKEEVVKAAAPLKTPKSENKEEPQGDSVVVGGQAPQKESSSSAQKEVKASDSASSPASSLEKIWDNVEKQVESVAGQEEKEELESQQKKIAVPSDKTKQTSEKTSEAEGKKAPEASAKGTDKEPVQPAKKTEDKEPLSEKPIFVEQDVRSNIVRPLNRKEGSVYEDEAVMIRVLMESDGMARPIRISFLDKDFKLTETGILSNNIERKLYGAKGFASVLLFYANDERNARPALMQFLGVDGQLVMTTAGFAQISAQYNAAGKEVKRTYLNITGSPVNITPGYAEMKRSYSNLGRISREEYKNAAGRPVVNQDLGYATMSAVGVSNQDEMTETQSFFDEKNEPVKVRGAFKHLTGIARKNNMTIENSYHNIDNSLMRGEDGYAIHFKRDRKDVKNPMEGYLDELSNFVDGPDGFAQLVYKKNADNTITMEYQDAKGQPVNHQKMKWSKVTYTPDSEGNMKNPKYADAEGKNVLPALLNE